MNDYDDNPGERCIDNLTGFAAGCIMLVWVALCGGSVGLLLAWFCRAGG